jgi:hypothetical protein
LYAPYRGYNNEGDDYFYDRRGGERNRSRERQREAVYTQQKSTHAQYQGNFRRDGSPDPDRHPSNFNPEIYMRENRDYRESRDRPPSDREHARDEPRRFPRNEREFGNSIREERAALGGAAGEFPDAYRLNDYRRDDNYDMDMFRGGPSGPNRASDIERGLGYLP